MTTDLNELSAEELVTFYHYKGDSLVRQFMEKKPKIEIDSIGNSVRCTMETPYLYTIRPYSGWRTFEDVESQT